MTDFKELCTRKRKKKISKKLPHAKNSKKLSQIFVVTTAVKITSLLVDQSELLQTQM